MYFLYLFGDTQSEREKNVNNFITKNDSVSVMNYEQVLNNNKICCLESDFFLKKNNAFRWTTYLYRSVLIYGLVYSRNFYLHKLNTVRFRYASVSSRPPSLVHIVLHSFCYRIRIRLAFDYLISPEMHYYHIEIVRNHSTVVYTIHQLSIGLPNDIQYLNKVLENRK